MGVTIYFEGKLKSEQEYNELMLFITKYAEDNGLPYHLFKNQKNILMKIKNGKMIDKEFFVKGIAIQPDKNSETLLFEFDEDLHTYTFCKTQFAGVKVHIALINFFKKIEQFFDVFKVTDDGEYWETHDEVLLQEKFDLVSKMMDEIEKGLKNYKENNTWRYN